MTLTTLGPVSSNFVVVGFSMTVVIAFVYGAVLWAREGQLDRHDEQLATLAYQMPALLEYLGVEIEPPVEDDSPEAMAEEMATRIATSNTADDAPTDEFPAIPETVPDGIPLAVQSALIEQRPSPTPRDLMTPETAEKQRAARAAFVEEQLAKFDFSGRSK